MDDRYPGTPRTDSSSQRIIWKKLLKFTREYRVSYRVLIHPGTDTETWGGGGKLSGSIPPGTGVRLK